MHAHFFPSFSAMSKNQPTSRWNPDDQRRPQKPRRPEEEATTELPSTSLPSTPVPLPPPTMSEFGMGSFFSNFGKSQEANEIQEDVTTNPPFTTASMFKDFTTDHPYSAGNVFKDTPRFRHEPDFSEDEDPGSVGVESPHMNQPSSEFKDYDMDKAKKAFKTFPDYSYEGDFSEDDQTPEDVALQRLKQQTFDPFKEDNHEDFTTDHPYSAGNVFKDEQPDFRQIESDFSSAETDEQHSVDMMELQRLNRPSADMHRMKSHQDFTTVPPFPARSSVDVTQDLRQESEVVDEEEAAASGNGEPRHLSWPSSSSSRKKTSHKKKTKDHRHSSQKNRFKDHRGYKHHSHSEDRHEPRPAHDHEESKHSYRPSHSAEPQDLQRERKPKVAPFRDVQEKPKKEEGFNFHNNFFSNFEKMAGTSFGEMPGPGFGKMSGPSFSQGFDFENFFVGDLINGNKGRGSKFPAFGDESKSNEDDYNGYGYQDEESSSMMSGYDKKTRGYHAKDSPSYHKKPMRGYHAKETRNSGVGYDKKPKAQSSVGYDKGSMGYHAESPSSYNKEPMRGYHEKDMPSFGGGYGKKPKGYHAKDSLSSSGYDKEPRGSYHTIGTGSGYGSSHYGSEGRYPHASGYGHDSYYGKKEHDNGGIYGNSASHGNSGKNSKYPAYGDKPKSTADHNNSYGYKSKNAPSTTKAPMSHQYKKPYHNSGKETTTAMPKAVVSQLKKKKPHTYGEQYMPYMKKEEPHHMVGGGGNSGSGNLYQFPSVRDEVNGYNDYGPKPTGSTGYGKKENRYQYSNPYHKQNSGSTTGFGNYHEDPYPSGYGEKYQLKEQRDKKVTMHPPAPRGTQSTPPQQKKKTQKEEPHLITPSPEMDMDNFGPDKGMFKEFPSFPKPSFMSDFPTFSFTDFEDSMSGFSPKFMDSFGHNSDAEGPGPKSKRGSLSGKKKAAADHHGGIHRAPLSTASPQDSQAPFGFNSLQGFDSFAPDNSNFFGGGRRLKKEAAPSLRISSLPSKWDTRVASYEEGDTETQLVPKGRPSIFRDDILSSSPSFTSPGGEPKATEIRALPFQPPPTGSGHQDTTRGLQELPPEFSANVAQNIGGRSVSLPKAENEDSDGTVDFGGASGPEGSFGWYSEHSVEKE